MCCENTVDLLYISLLFKMAMKIQQSLVIVITHKRTFTNKKKKVIKEKSLNPVVEEDSRRVVQQLP